MNSPSPPPAPDPKITAQAQGQMNKETAVAQSQLNMVDQYGPGGSSTFSQIGNYSDGTPKFQQNVNLSPSQQALYDSQNSISQQALDLGQNAIGRVGTAIDKPFDLNGLPEVNTDNTARIKAVEDALMSRLAPQIEQDRRRLETRLSNQGVTAGSDAYNRAVNLGEQAVNDARMQAVLAGSAEDSRLFNQNMAARNQGIQERGYLRAQPFNELSSLMGFSPGVQVPNFQNAAQTGIAPGDYQGAVAQKYAGDMQAWQAKQAAQGGMLGSIFGLGGQLGAAAILASDRRLKTNIKRIGTADNGLPLYSYTKFGKFEIGFMADEVEKLKPWAVVERGGFKHVNYSLAAA